MSILHKCTVHIIWMGVVSLHDATFLVVTCPITMTMVITMATESHLPIPGYSTIQLDILICCHGN